MARYSVDYDGDLSTTDDRVSYSSFDAATGAINDRGFDSYRVQDNRRGGGGGLGSFGSDRSGREAGFSALNEARPVRSGLGGLLGGIFGGQRQGGGLFGYTGLRDMVDGAGPGASGPRFQGGTYSGLLNAVGVRPVGQAARMAASPALAPQGARPMPAGATSQPERSFSPAPMSSEAPASRALTAQDVQRLQSVGMGMDAMIGEPALPEELAFLDRQPSQSAGPAPSAMTSVPQSPMLMGGQGAAPRPYVDMPQMEFGTIRPAVSRVPPMPQAAGVAPFASTMPAPSGMGQAGPNAGIAAQMRAFREMQARAAGRPLGMGGLLGR